MYTFETTAVYLDNYICWGNCSDDIISAVYSYLCRLQLSLEFLLFPCIVYIYLCLVQLSKDGAVIYALCVYNCTR